MFALPVGREVSITSPEECRNLDDIRQAIDRIDQDIIGALGQRMRYVLAASRYKLSEDSIPAPERVAAMLPERYRWAEDAGLDGKFVQALYAQIIQWFILEQIDYWRRQRSAA